MDIGDRIKERRELLGMSQEELAHKVGYKSRSSINKIEIDGRGLPQSKIVAFAKALETTPAYLMGWKTLSDEEIGDVFHENMQQPLNNSEMARFLSGANAVLKEMFEDKLKEQQLEEFNQKLREKLPNDFGMPKSNTIAAHFDGDEYTEDELDEIKQFAEFVKNKRKKES